MAVGQSTGRGRRKWTRDSSKELYWRAKLEEWRNSGLSVRAFARQHKIAEAPFYAWRREIAMRDREMQAKVQESEAEPERREALGRRIPSSWRKRAAAVPPTFVPLTPVDPPSAAEAQQGTTGG